MTFFRPIGARLVGVLAVVCLLPPAAARDESKDLLARAMAYFRTYQTQLTYLLADEDYSQERLDASDVATETRHMRGELFLTVAGANADLTAVHDVAEVDGQPVPDRQDIRSLLATAPAASIARLLKDRNARFNLGGVVRNFNEPTFALQVLESRHASRFVFEVKQRLRDGDTPLSVLAFVERKPPTLIVGRDEHPIFSFGELTIETATGRVRRTRLAYTDASLSGELTTQYLADAGVAMLVPAVFWEKYVARRGGGLSETITGTAQYTKFRRFEATSRIR